MSDETRNESQFGTLSFSHGFAYLSSIFTLIGNLSWEKKYYNPEMSHETRNELQNYQHEKKTFLFIIVLQYKSREI
jgi:hypothetical protein